MYLWIHGPTANLASFKDTDKIVQMHHLSCVLVGHKCLRVHYHMLQLKSTNFEEYFISITLDMRGCQIHIFLLSPWKHTLWVHIKGTLQWPNEHPQCVFMEKREIYQHFMIEKKHLVWRNAFHWLIWIFTIPILPYLTQLPHCALRFFKITRKTCSKKSTK